jgi:hypothetical protein
MAKCLFYSTGTFCTHKTKNYSLQQQSSVSHLYFASIDCSIFVVSEVSVLVTISTVGVTSMDAEAPQIVHFDCHFLSFYVDPSNGGDCTR